jgi:hypothetical protein
MERLRKNSCMVIYRQNLCSKVIFANGWGELKRALRRASDSPSPRWVRDFFLGHVDANEHTDSSVGWRAGEFVLPLQRMEFQRDEHPYSKGMRPGQGVPSGNVSVCKDLYRFCYEPVCRKSCIVYIKVGIGNREGRTFVS